MPRRSYHTRYNHLILSTKLVAARGNFRFNPKTYLVGEVDYRITHYFAGFTLDADGQTKPIWVTRPQEAYGFQYTAHRDTVAGMLLLLQGAVCEPASIARRTRPCPHLPKIKSFKRAPAWVPTPTQHWQPFRRGGHKTVPRPR